MVIKLGRVVTNLEGVLTIKSFNALITWSCKVTWQKENHSISATRVPMVTTFDTMITCFDAILPIKSHDFDHMDVRDYVTKQNHYISNTTVIMTTRPGRIVIYLEQLSSSLSYSTLWSRGFAISCDKLKPLYLHYCNVYNLQTRQVGSLP